MAGLDPAIPNRLILLNVRMRGSSPRMTETGGASPLFRSLLMATDRITDRSEAAMGAHGRCDATSMGFRNAVRAKWREAKQTGGSP
jgi:hypothetical protein